MRSLLLISVLSLFTLSTSVWAGQQCGVKPKENKWLVGKPCSLVASKTFSALLKSGTLKEAVKGMLNAYYQYQDIMNSDCLGMDRMLEGSKYRDNFSFQSTRQRKSVEYAVDSDLNGVIQEAIRQYYGPGQRQE
ncbi:MAG: hypothetical protein OEY58_19515 [Gammaproteobacteria bacterium]|nr:hypothetical protein [Gammaproteobacteria bacterium]